MKRITITIEDGLYDKLPKYGKSGVINLLIKQHYQKEGFDKLYESIKKKLLKDGLIKEQQPTFAACCSDYPTCGHWQWDMEKQQDVNTVTGEIRD